MKCITFVLYRQALIQRYSILFCIYWLFPLAYLNALSFLAGEGFLHHAVVLAQHPVPIYQLDIVGPWGRNAMGPQSVFLLRQGGPLGVVEVEDYVSFTHVKVPGNDGGGLCDLDQQLGKDVRW